MTKCIQCGECCKRLYWSDRIKIWLHSWRTEGIVSWVGRECPWLIKWVTIDDVKVLPVGNNKGTYQCGIFENRPPVCRDWPCGVDHQ